MPWCHMQIVFQFIFIDTFKISKGDNFTWMICSLDFQYSVYQCMVAQLWVKDITPLKQIWLISENDIQKGLAVVCYSSGFINEPGITIYIFQIQQYLALSSFRSQSI